LVNFLRFTAYYGYCRLGLKARIRLKIEIEIGFNQSEERKLISSLVNFALISQNSIQSQF